MLRGEQLFLALDARRDDAGEGVRPERRLRREGVAVAHRRERDHRARLDAAVGLGDRDDDRVAARVDVADDGGEAVVDRAPVDAQDAVRTEQVAQVARTGPVGHEQVDRNAVAEELHVRPTTRDGLVERAARGRGERAAAEVVVGLDDHRPATVVRDGPDGDPRVGVGHAAAVLEEDHVLAGEEPAVGHAGVDDGRVGEDVGGRVGHDGHARGARADGARGARVPAAAAVRVVVDGDGLTPVGRGAVAVAEVGVAGAVGAGAADAGDARGIGAGGADDPAHAAVVDVARGVDARTAASSGARGARRDAGARDAGLAGRARAAAGAAVGGVRAEIGAGVPAGHLARGAQPAGAGLADLARRADEEAAVEAAVATVKAVGRGVDADGGVGAAVDAPGRADRGDRPGAGAVRAALARGAGAAAGAAARGAVGEVGLAAVEGVAVAVAPAGVAGEPAAAGDADGAGVRGHGARVAAGAAVERVRHELALAAVPHHVVAVAEACAAGVAADAPHAGGVRVNVGLTDVGAGAAVGEVGLEVDAGRAAGARREAHASVARRAQELARAVGADLVALARVAAATAGALGGVEVDLAAVRGVAVAVGVARHAGVAAGAGGADGDGVRGRGAGPAAGAAVREGRARVGLAAVADGGVAVGEAVGALEPAAARDAHRDAVGADRRGAGPAAGAAVVRGDARVGLAAVRRVAVAVHHADEAHGRGVGARVGGGHRVGREGVRRRHHVGGHARVQALARAEAGAVGQARLSAPRTADADALARLVEGAYERRPRVGRRRERTARPLAGGEEDALLTRRARRAV